MSSGGDWKPSRENPQTTLVDCRWLGYSGKGRVTELLLEGLAQIKPPGRWILWGDLDRLTRFQWPGAETVPSRHSPLTLAGQRDLFILPKADRVIFLHAVRPMRGRRALVLLHDTIPLRWGNSWVRARFWRFYLKTSAGLAKGVFVYSRATFRRAVTDLGVTPMGTVHLPIDADRTARIRARRREKASRTDLMLYVGLLRPQKNLERAVQAFALSRFAETGGRFTIVGAGDLARMKLSEIAGDARRQLEWFPHCTDGELEELYASAGFLIQPSLEEGLGLPVVEALAAGVPVCCSNIDELIEASQGLAETFDPLSVPAMSEAIDRMAACATNGWKPGIPETSTPRHFAEEVLALLSNGHA